jgi:exopolysaccharide biosynthesis polyprenyl glycosylphosphotransferase
MILKIPKYKILLAVMDYCALLITFFIAFYIVGDPLTRSGHGDLLPILSESIFIMVFSCGMIFIFQYLNMYKIDVFLTRVKHTIQLLTAILYGIVTIAICNFFFQSSFSIPSRKIAVLFGVLSGTIFTLYRVIVFSSVYKFLNKNNITSRNTIIIGTDRQSKNIIIQAESDEYFGLNFLGFIDKNEPTGKRIYKNYLCLGPPSEIPTIVRDNNIAEIFIAASNIEYTELMSILDMCKSTKTVVRISSALFDIVHNKVQPENILSIPTVRMSSLNESYGIRFLKRLVDIIGSTIGLIIFSIPWLVIFILIRWTSPGPAIFKQFRIGRYGRPFKFYKFRSMTVDNENEDERARKYKAYMKQSGHGNITLSKIVNEKRITSIGRFIRQKSLDEMPQLINVLKGDMSLVGPRPCLPYEFEGYEGWHKRRLSVRPGCTGLWQVTNRAEGSFNDMVLLDLYYIDNMSPWFDLQIIIKTFPVMLFGRGGK